MNMLTNNQSHPKLKYAQCCIFYLTYTLMYNNKLQIQQLSIATLLQHNLSLSA